MIDDINQLNVAANMLMTDNLGSNDAAKQVMRSQVQKIKFFVIYLTLNSTCIDILLHILNFYIYFKHNKKNKKGNQGTYFL
jgi:hypothetical protein